MSDELKSTNKPKVALKNARKKTAKFIKLLIECITYKVVLFILMMLYVMYVFNGYKTNVQKQINKNTEEHLTTLVKESLEKINIKINDEYIVMNTIAQYYGDDIDKEITKQIFDNSLEGHSFEGITLIDNTGNQIVSAGVNGNLDEEFIRETLAGKNSISNIYSVNEKDEFLSLGVPIRNDENEVKDILVCNYNIKTLTEILDTSTFGKLGTTFIAQEDGTLVARPEAVNKNTNLFKLLDSINDDDNESIVKLKKYIKNGQSGVITYGKGKKKTYMCYNVVPETNWYSVSIVSANTIEPVAKNVSNLAMDFLIDMGVIVMVYVVVTLAIDMTILKKKKIDEEK